MARVAKAVSPGSGRGPGSHVPQDTLGDWGWVIVAWTSVSLQPPPSPHPKPYTRTNTPCPSTSMWCPGLYQQGAFWSEDFVTRGGAGGIFE